MKMPNVLLITQRLLNLKTLAIQDNFIIHVLHIICSVLPVDTFPCIAIIFFHFLNLKKLLDL